MEQVAAEVKLALTASVTRSSMLLHHLSLTAIPSRMHRISFDLRGKAAQGPISTGVGDGLGIP